MIAAKNLVTMRKEFRQLDLEEKSEASKIYDTATAEQKKPALSNTVISAWLAMKDKKQG